MDDLLVILFIFLSLTVLIVGCYSYLVQRLQRILDDGEDENGAHNRQAQLHSEPTDNVLTATAMVLQPDPYYASVHYYPQALLNESQQTHSPSSIRTPLPAEIWVEASQTFPYGTATYLPMGEERGTVNAKSNDSATEYR